MPLRTNLVFGIMPQQRPSNVARVLPSAPHLHCEIAVLLPGLVGNDLDAIHLDDCAWVSPARFTVVDCHHSPFDAQRSRAQRGRARFSFESGGGGGFEKGQVRAAVEAVGPDFGDGFDSAVGDMAENQSGREEGWGQLLTAFNYCS